MTINNVLKIMGLVSLLIVFPNIAQSNADSLSAKKVNTIANKFVQYANSISCDRLDQSDIKVFPITLEGEPDYIQNYVAVWSGIQQCSRGSGAGAVKIAVVSEVSNGFCVDVSKSSPIVAIDLPIKEKVLAKVIDNKNIAVSGAEYGPNDPNCCPSIKTAYLLSWNNEKGWVLIDKQRL
jgi:hypothetical protein